MSDRHDGARQLHELADEFHALVLAADPFTATGLGVPGFDHLVPDVTEAAVQAHRGRVASVVDRLRALPREGWAPAHLITAAALESAAHGELADVDAQALDYTVSHFTGLGTVVYIAAQAAPADAAGATDHLARLRAFPGYLDACSARLREGSETGRSPVAALVAAVQRQIDDYLASPVETDPMVTVPAPPIEWDGEPAWRAELAAVVRDELRPAVQRYREAITEVPCRDDEHCGLIHLPGGEELYQRLVLRHTTLPVSPQELHEVGVRIVVELQERMAVLGGELGLSSHTEINEAIIASMAERSPEQAMSAAAAAIRRAEGCLPAWFDPPLPPPCAIQPMSTHLASGGVAPHYTAPSADGARVGTYWFNAETAGTGSGWDLESVAFHEAVPGHHMQISRMLGLSAIPQIQSQGSVTAYLEGWALYTEVLADEMGLYSGTQQRLGSLAMQLFRAARLVVDTGIHALGWSRQRAIDYLADVSAINEATRIGEVNRYIAVPGQALSYMTGQVEIMALRREAEQRLGDAFDIRGFHTAVLDSGAIPLPALRVAVNEWVETAAGR